MRCYTFSSGVCVLASFLRYEMVLVVVRLWIDQLDGALTREPSTDPILIRVITVADAVLLASLFGHALFTKHPIPVTGEIVQKIPNPIDYLSYTHGEHILCSLGAVVCGAYFFQRVTVTMSPTSN